MSTLPTNDPFLEAAKRKLGSAGADPFLEAARRKVAQTTPATPTVIPTGFPTGGYDMTGESPRPAPVAGPPLPAPSPFDLTPGAPRQPDPNSLANALQTHRQGEQAAQEAGFLGQTSAAVRTAGADMLRQSTSNIERLMGAYADNPPPGQLPIITRAQIEQQGQQLTDTAEGMFGVTPQTRQIAERAGLAPRLIAGAMDVAAPILDPVGLGAGAVAKGLMGRAAKGAPEVLSAIERAAGRKTAEIVGRTISGAGHVGAFGGLHAAASYPAWDTDPQGGIKTVQDAIGSGMVAGGAVGIAGPLAKAVGRPTRAPYDPATSGHGTAPARTATEPATIPQDRPAPQTPTTPPESPQTPTGPRTWEEYADQKDWEAGMAEGAKELLPQPPKPEDPSAKYPPYARKRQSWEDPPRPPRNTDEAKAWMERKRQAARDRVAEQETQRTTQRTTQQPTDVPRGTEIETTTQQEPQNVPHPEAKTPVLSKPEAGLRDGWSIEHRSDSGSVYYKHDASGDIIRVSDHYVPDNESGRGPRRSQFQPWGYEEVSRNPKVSDVHRLMDKVEREQETSDVPESKTPAQQEVPPRSRQEPQVQEVRPDAPNPQRDAVQGDEGQAALLNESIGRAAVKSQRTGKVYEGDNHGTAANAMHDAEGKPYGDADMGFTTSAGRFVDRVEADRIAKGAKQIGKRVREKTADGFSIRPDGLMAEDLKKKPATPKVASATPDVAPAKPAPRADQPKGKPLTRQSIEKALIERHEAIAGPQETDLDAGAGKGQRVFYKRVPTELSERMTQKEMDAAGVQVVDERGRSGAEDYVYDAHNGDWDSYVSELKGDSTGPRVAKAKKFLRDYQGDPESTFLSALHDSIPTGKKLKNVQAVKTEKLKVGDSFTVNGIEVRVEDAGDGSQQYLVLKDGDDLPETPLEALSTVPMDKGSMGEKNAHQRATTRTNAQPKNTAEAKARIQEKKNADTAQASVRGGEEAVGRDRPDRLAEGNDSTVVEREAAPQPQRDARLAPDKAAGDSAGRPVEPAKAVGEGDADPNTIGLNKAEQDRFRKETGLSELPDHERRGWEEVLAAAKKDKLDEDALIVAARVRRDGGQMTDAEHAGAVLKAADLANRYDSAIETAHRLAESGDAAAAKHARASADAIMEQIDLLTDATRNSRRETARALSIGRMMVNRESFQLADVVQRATEAKGERLAPEQHAQLESLTKLYKVQAEKLANAEKLIQKQKAESEKLRAGQMVRRIAARKETAARIDVKRQRLKIERNDILKDLQKIGVRTNEVVGASAEALYHVGRLAVNIMKEGAVTLEYVVSKVKEHVPDITDEEVYRAINAKDPKAQKAAQDATTKRISDLRKQAELLTRLDDLSKGIEKPKPTPEPASPKVAQLREKVANIREAKGLEAKIEDAKAGKLPEKRTPKEPAENIKALRATLTELRAQAYKTIEDGAKLERAVKTINELQEQLDSHSRALKKPAKGEPPADLAALRQKAADLRKQMRVEDTLTDLTNQLETGDFKQTVRPFVEPISPEMERAQLAVRKARQNIRRAIEDMRPKTAGQKFDAGLNFLRTMRATADVSYALRQGAMLSARRPGAATNAFGKSLQAAISEHTAEQIDNAIRTHPNQFLRDRAGLYLAELGDGTGSIKPREEAFMSNAAENIPGFGRVVAASERNMVTGLNLLRVAAFDGFLEAHPNSTRAELAAWADYVNKASGRGDLGQSAGAARTLSTIFFAPRFAVSRFQTPWTVVKYWKMPRVRNEIAKDMAAFYGTGVAALIIAGLAGATVGTDPRSPDFGKIIFGDTRVDIWGGEVQAARLIGNMATNGYDRAKIGLGYGKAMSNADRSSAENYDPLDAVGKFARYKLAPGITVPHDLWTGEDITGQKVSRLRTAATATMPMLWNDVYEAYTNYQHPGAKVGAAAGTLIGGGMGLGVSTYPPNEPETRRQYLRLKHAGQTDTANALRKLWNDKNPDNQISENFTGEPKKKK